MTASIDRIKSTINQRGGIARPNNFLVELPSLPGFDRANDNLNILCRSATIPSKQILTSDRRIGMEFEKVAYGYAVDDVSMSFLLTNDYYVRKYFDRWKNLIIGEDKQIVAYKDNYQKPVVIHQLRNSIPSSSNSITIGDKVTGPTLSNIVNNTINNTVNSVASTLQSKSSINATISTYSVELINAFPTTVSQIDFNNEQDGILELTVAMSYTNFKRRSGTPIFFNI